MGGPAEVGPWPNAGEIYALYVRQGFQRRGLGRELVRAAVGYLTNLGMKALVFRTLATNASASRFYESLGGQIVGEVEKEDYGFRNLERIYGWEDSSPLQGF